MMNPNANTGTNATTAARNYPSTATGSDANQRCTNDHTKSTGCSSNGTINVAANGER